MDNKRINKIKVTKKRWKCIKNKAFAKFGQMLYFYIIEVLNNKTKKLESEG